jgi:hypothetical protein
MQNLAVFSGEALDELETLVKAPVKKATRKPARKAAVSKVK